ncbi:centrosome-associated protein 350 isoform X2 [Rhinatrema bivittatum]|uniref:centrosome-associated protein 350 isoform X2 n=1 Tax=Rhinatrema bivittatum TaxID=194408 RepID=UPI00112D64B3|nr:centrosome-associated protein 350 isoform X2 [Rhinatrema bivittatum]
MWSGQTKEGPSLTQRHLQSKETLRDVETAWNATAHSKAALRHIENKLEAAPTSTAIFDSIMDTKKPSTSATRKISRKDGKYLEDSSVFPQASKSSSRNKLSKEKLSRSPLRATTLDSNVEKSGRVEFREPIASYRDTYGTSSYLTSSQLEAKCLLTGLEGREIEEKTESMSCIIHDQGTRNILSSDFDSTRSSAVDDTVVRYLNDRPAIDALKTSEGAPVRGEVELTSKSQATEGQNAVQKMEQTGLRLVETPQSSVSNSSSHRLEILKRKQSDAKLEKLKERIRKQWEHSEEVYSKGRHQNYSNQPVMLINMENTMTAKVRKVTIAPPAPAYKGFNPIETKIRTPDGKVWPEEQFHNISRELYGELAAQLTEGAAVKEKPTEKSRDRKTLKTVRKVQKIAQLTGSDSKLSGHSVISTTSWRDGQKLVKKILGPVPKLENRRAESSDRGGREKISRPGASEKAESDTRLEASRKNNPTCSERSRSRVRSEENLKKAGLGPIEAGEQEKKEDSVNKDFLPVEIRGILDDLQLDLVDKDAKQEKEKPMPNQKTIRSHSPIKRKQDKGVTNEDPHVISKKRHYDTDKVRQYIVRQQEERKKRQNEERRAQKEAVEQKSKRLQDLYKKQKEAFIKTKSSSVPEPAAARRLQETYSKLLLEQAWREEPSAQEAQPRPGYQPSGESDKENKGQERSPSASSSSDLSLSEPPQPLTRTDLMEPAWMHPDRLNQRVQVPQSLSTSGAGGLFSQLRTLEQTGLLQKDLESVLSTRRNYPILSKGSMTLQSQPYSALPASQPDPSTKSDTSQYKKKLDRIEALKATAASLSSRIESEAKKLAGSGINYGSAWNSDYDHLQASQDAGRWAKPVSPPVRENSEDLFSARIQKMLGTCVSHATFDDSLPGVGNLHEFKKLPETIRPHSAVTSFALRPSGHRVERAPSEMHKKQPDPSNTEKLNYSLDNQGGISHDSSSGSISEGLLLSEGSLSDREEAQMEPFPLKVPDILKKKEFCVGETNLLGPIKEFQKEAEKHLPLFPQTSGVHNKGTWEELSKGSPHSVINIFAKSYQLFGKGFEERSDGGSPVLQPLLPAQSPSDSVAYDDDFISSQGSGSTRDRQVALERSAGSSSSLEELPSRKSPFDLRPVEITSQHSSKSRSAASSRSSASSKRRGKPERLESLGNAQHLPLEEDKPPSCSEFGSQPGRKPIQSKPTSPSQDHEQNPETDSTLEDLSVRSFASLSSDAGRSRKSLASPPLGSQNSLQVDSPGNLVDRTRSLAGLPTTVPASGLKHTATFSDANLGLGKEGTGTATAATTPMRFSPAALKHRMTAELSYLSAIEESVHQLSDMERVRGISLAQQETVSLAQILKAQQQRHELDLALLKIKAEQEAQESRRQLEDARQKAAEAHAETLQELVQSRQDVAETFQETTSKIVAQQAEASRLTADTARQIREITELARTHISEAFRGPAPPITTLFDHQRQNHSEFMKQLRGRTETDRKSEASTSAQVNEEQADSKQQYSPLYDSFSESSRSKNHDRSSSSSRQESPSMPSSKEKKVPRQQKLDGSAEKQDHTGRGDSLHSDSIPSLLDEKDSTSIATEYSLKFDESMTEDEIEEKSFRSLLPSESHRRFNLEKKRGHRDDSDEEASPEKATLANVKELSMPFSGGQDSFSKFTMEMVRQYMKEEEMRAAHQSSLLRLRQKALKEKTKAELAWLEHQKKRLRDKGEDDKMPPLRKRQRGLLLKLQQEQAEIKRLQDANKAARKERQLILKQQEEIERIHQTTMKLQEKLKSAEECKLEIHSEADNKQCDASSPIPTDLETRSPSPISISGSETSSIMQKLKKMRSRMDEKHCSPVHCFFSVFTSHHWASLSVCFPNLHPKFQLYIYKQLVRFLTKREQKLMQRRQHAEELLEWKRRLDAEEAEIRQMEKKALAAWDRERVKVKTPKRELEEQKDKLKETGSEEESLALSSHVHSESSVPEEIGSPAAESVPSENMTREQPPSPERSEISEDVAFSQESKQSVSPRKLSLSKSNISVSKLDSSKGSPRGGRQLRVPRRSQQLSQSWSEESLSVTQSETMSDQSDIESRIWALKEELRKRKTIVDQLKKEQKKRQKERLKAQEASLIKQLESYDEFIKKTQAELSGDLETVAKPQIKTPSATEKSKTKSPQLPRPETRKSQKLLSESERSRGSLESIAEHTVSLSPENSLSVSVKKSAKAEIIAEESSRSHFPVLESPVRSRTDLLDTLDSPPSSPKNLQEGNRITEVLTSRLEEVSGDESIISSHRSDIPEEIKICRSEESEVEDVHNQHSLKSDPVLRLDQGQKSPPSTTLQPDLLFVSQQHISAVLDLDIESLQKKETGSEDVGNNQSIASEKTNGHSRQRKLEERPYSEDFNVLSVRNEPLFERTSQGDVYKDDFESSSARSTKKELQGEGHARLQSLREKSLSTRASRSGSTSFGSDDEISEHLSEKFPSVSGSVHSERLLQLISPTELLKDKERHDVQDETGPVAFFTPSATTPKDADSLQGFELGERILVSNLHPGTLRFKGTTQFAKGVWAGVELDKSEGNNNGTYDGVKYFDCKEKHGIFAPPHKISHVPEDIDAALETDEDEDSFFDDTPLPQKGQDWEDQKESSPRKDEEEQRENTIVNFSLGETPAVMTAVEAPMVESINRESSSKDDNSRETHAVLGLVTSNHSQLESPGHTAEDENDFSPAVGVLEYASAIMLEDNLDKLSTEELKKQQALVIKPTVNADTLAPSIMAKPSTPLLDLLTKEKDQLEALLSVPATEEKQLHLAQKDENEPVVQQEKVSLLTDSLLQNFLKDAVVQLQEIQKVRKEKILLNNEELQKEDLQQQASSPRVALRQLAVPEERAARQQSSFLITELEDEQEEAASPDLCTRPESPVFGASGQEELAKRLAELELSRGKFLSVLGDDQDWFDEDFGLSSHKVPQKSLEEVKPKVELQKAPKVFEEPCLAVPHTAAEVEDLVRTAAEELWKWKELGHDIQSLSIPPEYLGSAAKEQDIESIGKQVYKKAVFDLTREIFSEIFAEDPSRNQPVWMKPCRVTSSYFRRVKDPSDLEEIKTFLTIEVLKLFNLKKEPNHKTDWQKMMKFGRKKRDRVDHILVQELHEEEAQWVNYDEDELCVKMQLADGIFEALIKDTVDVLHQIQQKQDQILPV